MGSATLAIAAASRATARATNPRGLQFSPLPLWHVELFAAQPRGRAQLSGVGCRVEQGRLEQQPHFVRCGNAGRVTAGCHRRTRARPRRVLALCGAMRAAGLGA
eukprot:366417-Chlamydomonas_euryale.AAC.11